MEKTWAISGIDLHLDLTGTRVRAGLEEALRDAVRTGRLAAGTRLPASRVLAADLGIARNTVATAYGQLVAEGWLTAVSGSGTRVATLPPTSQERAPSPEPVPRPVRYDLRAGTPTLSAFPRTAWIASARRALAGAPAEAFGYGDPRGLPVLRQAVAEYVSRARGVRADPDRVLICSGFVQGLGLLGRVLRDRGGSRVAMESYGHHLHRRVLESAGLAPVPLAVDADGARVEDLGAAAAVVLTAAHQFPLGMPLAAHRRTQVIAWAREGGGVVVEDDYDGEFRYDRQPVGALQALDPEQVVHAGTTSKTLVPGLRLGWLVLPAYLVDDVVDAKRLADGQSAALDQLVLADLIASGGYDRHVRRSRLAHRRRRDRLVTALRNRVPDIRVRGIAAGMHVLLELPGRLDEQEVVAAAAERGLHLDGLDSYRLSGESVGPGLVIGYGTPPDHAFTGALARLVAVLE